MRELSLHILDIVQNSISAGATLIEIVLDVNTKKDKLTIKIVDNGHGMTREQLQKVRDPFYTTRTTRRVGMGIPLFRMAAEMAGGHLDIQSETGVGTTVMADFVLSHIDRMPLGNMESTMTTLIRLNPELDFDYRFAVNDRRMQLDTREIRKILEEVSLDQPDVITWIEQYIQEQRKALSDLPNI